MNIGIVGAGTIGAFLIKGLNNNKALNLVALADIDSARAHRVLKDNGYPESLLMPLENFPENTDVYIETASASVAAEIAKIGLERGKIVIPASIGGLGDIEPYRLLAEKNGGRLILPSGAICGLDALKAIPPDSITSVVLKTTKPSKTLAESKYLIEKGINTLEFTEPTQIFSGTARDAAKAFPKSINVAAALSHAAIGLDRTLVEIWADPESDRNVHAITIKSGHGDFYMESSNVPFEENPRTSRLAAYSILATIQNLTRPVIAGT